MNDKNQTNGMLFIIAIALVLGLLLTIQYKTGIIDKNDKVNNPNWQKQDWESTINKPIEKKPESKPPVIPANPQTYQEALDLSKQTGKKIFLFFESDSCYWCKKMKKEVLSNSKVKQALSNHIIFYVNSKTIADKYRISSYPTYFITDHTETMKKRGIGYKPTQQFLWWLNNKNTNNIINRPSPG